MFTVTLILALLAAVPTQATSSRRQRHRSSSSGTRRRTRPQTRPQPRRASVGSSPSPALAELAEIQRMPLYKLLRKKRKNNNSKVPSDEDRLALAQLEGFALSAPTIRP